MSPCVYLWEAQLHLFSHECAEVYGYNHESTVAVQV